MTNGQRKNRTNRVGLSCFFVYPQAAAFQQEACRNVIPDLFEDESPRNLQQVPRTAGISNNYFRGLSIAAWAAARRATGTRNGEQLT